MTQSHREIFEKAGGDRLALACDAARDAGRLLLEREGRIGYTEKGRRDLVTAADREAQRVIRERILDLFPDDAFLGEEDGEGASGGDPFARSRHLWVVDPLDGTTNFVHSMPHYSISIACFDAGEPLIGIVYDPHRDELFAGVRGAGAYLGERRLCVTGCGELERALVAVSFAAHVDPSSEEVAEFLRLLAATQAVRRMGSAALNLAYLAAGRFDAYWARNGKIWDVAAGVLLVREAGGELSGVTGEPFQWQSPHCAGAATAALHRELLHVASGS